MYILHIQICTFHFSIFQFFRSDFLRFETRFNRDTALLLFAILPGFLAQFRSMENLAINRRNCSVFMGAYVHFYRYNHNKPHSGIIASGKWRICSAYLLSSWNIAQRIAAAASLSRSRSARSSNS